MVSLGKTSARTVPRGADGISARVEGENAGDGQLGALEAKEGESVGNSGDSSGTREESNEVSHATQSQLFAKEGEG